jgi:hypothetical protein
LLLLAPSEAKFNANAEVDGQIPPVVDLKRVSATSPEDRTELE